jgi:hypothetical protein
MRLAKLVAACSKHDPENWQQPSDMKPSRSGIRARRGYYFQSLPFRAYH